MEKIKRCKETMTSKERVRRTFQFEKTDRVTIGFEANPQIYKKLCVELGIYDFDEEKLHEALGVDYRGLWAAYTGKELFQAPPNRRIDPMDGYIMRWVEHADGGYWDFCDFPLKDATDEMFENYPIPDPDDFNYDRALERVKYHARNGKAIYVGGPAMPDIINSNGRLMGMEDVLCHLILDDEAAMRFIHRRVDFQVKYLERLISKCRDYLDFIWLGEDLGTQIAPMISMELYREKIKPIHKQFADLGKAFGLPILIHTCGCSSWAYEDFIELGFSGVDTLQPEATNMSPEYLVRHFGGRLNFRGCISTAGPLSYGTAEEVEQVCKNTLETMMPTRGYHFAPTHQIQDNTPVENVIAMYNSAYKYGQY